MSIEYKIVIQKNGMECSKHVHMCLKLGIPIKMYDKNPLTCL